MRIIISSPLLVYSITFISVLRGLSTDRQTTGRLRHRALINQLLFISTSRIGLYSYNLDLYNIYPARCFHSGSFLHRVPNFRTTFPGFIAPDNLPNRLAHGGVEYCFYMAFVAYDTSQLKRLKVKRLKVLYSC